MLVRLAIITALLVSVTTAAFAQPLKDPSRRAGLWEFSLAPQFQFQADLEFEGGSSVSVNDDLGLGFAVNYNISEQLAIVTEFGWNAADYSASFAYGASADSSFDVYGVLDTGGMLFNLAYNVMPTRLTPYVQAGIGYTWIDSNIPSGSFAPVCWWDPWYGYVCAPYQTTYGSTRFTYGGALGLRFDSIGRFFMKAGYRVQWLDLPHADPNRPFQQIRVDFGSLM